MTRHLLSKFLLWAFALLTLPAVGQEQTVWDGTTVNTDWYNNNTGATEFTISTAAELAGLAQLVNNETEDFNGQTIYLDADIQLNNTEDWESWNENTTGLNSWTPIGRSAVGTYFEGTFDGQWHTISGIYINNEEEDNQGLFGFVTGGTIQNVNVAESYIRASRYVGGIVGYIEKASTVLNCSNSGTVIGTSEANAIAGGIVGYNNSSEVSNCFNSGTVKVIGAGTGPGYPSVGGIVGYNYGSAIVSNCSNSGTVTGTGDNACIGGIVGYSNFICAVSNSSNTGAMSGNSEAVGGIIGSNTSYASVTNSYYLESTCEAGVGNDSGTVPSEEDMEKTEEEYKSGEVAYLLQDGQTEQIWGQDLDSGYPIPLGSLNEEARDDYVIYTVTFTYTVPGVEEETKVIQYGNSGTAITAPTVAPVEGYTFAWDKEVPTQFGAENMKITGTFTKDEEPEEPTEPEEPDVPQITYYDVRFVQPNDSVRFAYRGDQVREGNTFSFSASVAEGYDPRTLVVEYRRGPVGIWREATLDTDGKYHIRANYADLYIRARVEPLNPTGVEAIGDEAVKVYTDNGAICVYTPSEERVIIVSMSGAVVRMDEQVGTRRYDLPKGIYIVRVGDEVFKVSN